MSKIDLYTPGKFGVVRGALMELGFKVRDLPPDGPLRRHSCLLKKLEGVEPVCHFNDVLLMEVHLRIFAYTEDNLKDDSKYNFNVECSINGGILDGNAGTVKIYGVSMDDLVSKLPDIERRLIAAWKAIAVDC